MFVLLINLFDAVDLICAVEIIQLLLEKCHFCCRFPQSMERLLGHIVQLKDMLQKSVTEHDTVCCNFCALLHYFYVSSRRDWQLEAYCSRPAHASLRSSVTRLVNGIFWKQTNRFWCHLAQVVSGALAWNGQLWGYKVKGQGHLRPKIDFEAWCRHHCPPFRSSRFFSFSYNF